MQNELDIVRDVSLRFEGAGIDYMLTGSMAMNYYAQPRMTRDIDMVVALASDEAETIMRIFAPDYYVSREAVADSIARESLFNIIHEESVIKVDCIVRKSTPYRRAEFERRTRITVEDFSTWIASKEDLIMPAMTDTAPEIAEMVRARLMARSGAERFLMGVQMFESARRMVLASLPSDLSKNDRRRLLFERIYGEPLPAFTLGHGLRGQS